MHFSIVIPLYNKEKYISRALDSILDQTYKKYEVLIINDGSSDNSVKVILEYFDSLDYAEKSKIRLLQQANKGVSAARNFGARQAQFDYIAFLDADDYWENKHLENLKLLINKFSEDVDIFSNATKHQVSENIITENPLGKYNNSNDIVDPLNDSILIKSILINASSVCIKKIAILKSPFPENMETFEDSATWARISSHRGFAFSNKRLSVYAMYNSEASNQANFINLFRYEKILFSINRNKIKVAIHCMRFNLMYLLYKKSEISLSEYLKKSIPAVCLSPLLTFSILITFLFPKKFILLIRKSK